MKKMKTLALAMGAVAMMAMSSCSLTLPVDATSNEVGSKVGTASGTGYLGVLFFNADASIRTAAKNGGITKISTVDIKQKNILNLIVTYETIVTGE
ncbi:TRL-like family protein [Halocola ammonii]